MVQRLFGATLIALLAATILARGADVRAAAPGADQWFEGEGYDWWTDCSDVPDPLEFLPIYLGSEGPGFVDLNQTILRSKVRWRVLQYTKDKEFGPTSVQTGRWYGGMGADEWPPGSRYAQGFLDRFRVTAFEVNGTRHVVDPSCVIVLPTDDHTIGLYNAWVRFNEPGVHTLKIYGRQILDFFFTHPNVERGLSDPFGLEGRRVFLAGETLGDALDGDFVHTYELHVGKYDQ